MHDYIILSFMFAYVLLSLRESNMIALLYIIVMITPGE